MFTAGNRKFGVSPGLVSALILPFSHGEKEPIVQKDSAGRSYLSLRERAGVRVTRVVM